MRQSLGNTARRYALTLFGAALMIAAMPRIASAEETPVTVFAAASLADALKAAAASWQAKGHGSVVIYFGSSSIIAKQIEAGAPADLFASADEKWMTFLSDKALIETDSIRRPVGNDLVLVGGPDAKAIPISPTLDLAGALKGGRLAIGDPESVPAGRYAEQALTKLGLWDSVKERVAPAENVRAALALVQRGEAPLGVVYATDARGLDDVAVVGAFPADTHDAIVYPMAIVAGKARPEVTAFFDFLTGADGKAVFASYGFKILE